MVNAYVDGLLYRLIRKCLNFLSRCFFSGKKLDTNPAQHKDILNRFPGSAQEDGQQKTKLPENKGQKQFQQLLAELSGNPQNTTEQLASQLGISELISTNPVRLGEPESANNNNNNQSEAAGTQVDGSQNGVANNAQRNVADQHLSFSSNRKPEENREGSQSDSFIALKDLQKWFLSILIDAIDIVSKSVLLQSCIAHSDPSVTSLVGGNSSIGRTIFGRAAQRDVLSAGESAVTEPVAIQHEGGSDVPAEQEERKEKEQEQEEELVNGDVYSSATPPNTQVDDQVPLAGNVQLEAPSSSSSDVNTRSSLPIVDSSVPDNSMASFQQQEFSPPLQKNNVERGCQAKGTATTALSHQVQQISGVTQRKDQQRNQSLLEDGNNLLPPSTRLFSSAFSSSAPLETTKKLIQNDREIQRLADFRRDSDYANSIFICQASLYKVLLQIIAHVSVSLFMSTHSTLVQRI